MLHELYSSWQLFQMMDERPEGFYETPLGKEEIQQVLKSLRNNLEEVLKNMGLLAPFEKGKIDYYTMV